MSNGYEDRSGGALFFNRGDRTAANGKERPLAQGNIELSQDLIKEINAANTGGKVKLQLTGWERKGNKAGKFLSLSLKLDDYDKRDHQGAGSPSTGPADEEIPF